MVDRPDRSRASPGVTGYRLLIHQRIRSKAISHFMDIHFPAPCHA